MPLVRDQLRLSRESKGQFLLAFFPTALVVCVIAGFLVSFTGLFITGWLLGALLCLSFFVAMTVFRAWLPVT